MPQGIILVTQSSLISSLQQTCKAQCNIHFFCLWICSTI